MGCRRIATKQQAFQFTATAAACYDHLAELIVAISINDLVTAPHAVRTSIPETPK
jgi:hypothetical protein